MKRCVKFLLLFLGLALSTLTHAEITLKIYRPDVVDQDDLEIKIPMVSNGSTFELEVDLPSGDATSLNSAAKTYVPVLGSPDYPLASIFSHNSSSKGADLPQALSSAPPSASLAFEKEITVTSGTNDLYLHAAVASNLDTDDWRVIGRNTSAISSAVQEERHTVSFDIADFCDNSDLLECEDLVDSDKSVMAQVYFFLSESILPLNSAVDPENSDYNHGVYYEVHLSSDVHASDPTSPSDAVNLVEMSALERGDESLKLTYNSNSTIDHFDKVIVAKYLDPGADTAGGRFIGDNTAPPGHGPLELFGTEEGNEFPRLTEGTISVEPLTNGEPAILSVAFMDKFGFVTPLSLSRTQTPLEIEVLLQEQSCFFFTAGFGREHWVVDELKRFRDEVMLASPIGSVFVDVYYEFAPRYAYLILDSPWLQAFVRGVAYILVFMIQSYLIVFGLVALLLLGFIWRLSNKKSLFSFFPKSSNL